MTAPVLLRSRSRHEAAVRSAFAAAGARSPATAVPLALLPPLPPAVLHALVDRGEVREGAPGTYYLFHSTAADARRRRLLWVAVVWLVVLLLPVLFLQLTHP